MKKIIATLSLIALSITYVYAALPIIGVGTHFGQKKNYIHDLIRWSKPGQITSIRDEIYWKDVERSPGELRIEGRAAFSLENITKAHAAGLQPLIILSYGNPNYDGGSQPSSQEGRIAFARYASFIFNQTKHLSPIFEVWNEWNIGAGTTPKTRNGSVHDYVELVKTTSLELRKSGFTGKILGGALGDDYPNWRWAQQAASLGLLNYVDGLSIHLYNYSNPRLKRGTTEFLKRASELDSLIKANNKGKSFPIYITEIGWPNHFDLKGISMSEAGVDAEILLNEATQYSFIHGIWFYEFLDGGPDPFEKEHHFGILKRDGEEKPLGCAIRHWHRHQSKVSWTKFSISNGLAIADGSDLHGNLVRRVWPSPQFGQEKSQFTLTPSTHDKNRIIARASCNEDESIGQPFNSSQFPTDQPITIISPKGMPRPAIMRVE